jgi:hypothetical protein
MDSPEKQPLAELSPNKTSPTKPTSQTSDHTFQPNGLLKGENAARQCQQGKQSYVSPSDTIMSPTTKKLSEIKGRRFGAGKPQSLFAKTVEKRALFSNRNARGEEIGASVGGDGADSEK